MKVIVAVLLVLLGSGILGLTGLLIFRSFVRQSAGRVNRELARMVSRQNRLLRTLDKMASDEYAVTSNTFAANVREEIRKFTNKGDT